MPRLRCFLQKDLTLGLTSLSPELFATSLAGLVLQPNVHMPKIRLFSFPSLKGLCCRRGVEVKPLGLPTSLKAAWGPPGTAVVSLQVCDHDDERTHAEHHQGLLPGRLQGESNLDRARGTWGALRSAQTLGFHAPGPAPKNLIAPT